MHTSLSLDELKNLLNISVDDTSLDDTLTYILSEAESIVAETFGGSLEYQQYTDTLKAQSPIVLPKHYPVKEVISCKLDGKDISYFIQNSQIFILNSIPFIGGTVEIIYTAGFQTLPTSLKMAIYFTAIKIFKLSQMKEPDKTIDILDNNIDTLLTPYKRFII